LCIAGSPRGLIAPQVLRALVLMRLKNWDYRELRERIADGITLRQFTDFYCEDVPKHDAFNRSFNRLTPATLKAMNDDGEQVPTSGKIYSIFEPHTDLIKRGKVRAPVEFGHKVFLAESATGLVTSMRCSRAIRRTNSVWRRRSSVTAASSAVRPPSTAPTHAFDGYHSQSSALPRLPFGE
jgi:Transposase domain (DUF772)